MLGSKRTVLALGCSVGLLACVHSPPTLRTGRFADAHAASALAEGEHVVPTRFAANLDEAALGKILLQPYVAERPLAEQLSVNPCAEHLAALAPVEGSRLLEDAEPLPLPNHATTHRYFRLSITRRLEKRATGAYAECCKNAACGTAYLQTLSSGSGEISLAKHTTPGGDADVALERETDARVLELGLVERKAVEGIVAFGLGNLAAAPKSTAEKIERSPKAIEVRPRPEHTDKFEYCLKTGCITENEFIRRYTALTGSRELTDYLRDRVKDFHELGAGLGILGGALSAFGATFMATSSLYDTSKDRNGAMAGGALTLGMGLGIGIVGLLFGTLPHDGTTVDNWLTRAQAERFVDRYNRALLGER